ncbi:MAG TPA: tetratricopeptide repeat protein, partial [Ktedonobacteraceae bacterium]|nr:tetratricopeptide repeat protein [Ktedonobacteraceae bacterium]
MQSTISPRLVDLVYLYAPQDEALQEALNKHLIPLKTNGFITSWSNSSIKPGVNTPNEFERRLSAAHIILLLISADFMGLYYESALLKRVQKRYDAGEVTVIPVIVRATDWREAWFGHLQALPRNNRPVTSWSNRDEAFLEVAKGIQEIVKLLPVTLPPGVQQKASTQWIADGNAYYKDRRYIDALGAFEQALSVDPQSVSALEGKGNALHYLNRNDEALTAFEQAMHSGPTAQLYNEIGEVLYSLNRYEEA